MSATVVLALRVVLAAVLYIFLAWALFTCWQQVRQQGFLLFSRKVPLLSLTRQAPGASPRVRNFTQPEITIGRNPVCDFCLTDDSVSSRHARLSHHHGQWWLEDLASTNGTSLNENRLEFPTVVVSGDVIACGEARLTITFPGQAPAASAPQEPQNGKKA